MHFVKFSIISCVVKIFLQIKQRIFTCTYMQVLHFFSRQNSETFDITHLSPVNRRKVINSQNSLFFWPILYIRSTVVYFCRPALIQQYIVLAVPTLH